MADFAKEGKTSILENMKMLNAHYRVNTVDNATENL